MFEGCLEPKNHPIRFALPKQLSFENPINFNDLLVAHSLQIESKKFGHFANNKLRIDHPYQWFMRNPLFHRSHRNAIHIVPKLNLVVAVVLIMNHCALIAKYVWEQ